jgi:hypothetical protein
MKGNNENKKKLEANCIKNERKKLHLEKNN